MGSRAPLALAIFSSLVLAPPAWAAKPKPVRLVVAVQQFDFDEGPALKSALDRALSQSDVVRLKAAPDVDTAKGKGAIKGAMRGRGQEALRSFFAEKLQVELLPTLNRPDPALTNGIRALMVEETLRSVDDVVWERNADARELLTAKDTFVNDELAAYYGFPLPGSGDSFTRVQPPDVEGRAGIFTQGAFLVRFAHPDRSSPTLRGKFIREQLLCSAVPAPPPEVVTTLPAPSDSSLPQTTRQRMSAHATSPSCVGCHSSMDPLGYALEHFDQFGRYRAQENGLPIDASADLDGEAADGAAAFMQVLDHRSDMVSCLVRGLFRNATGHIDEAGEDPSLYDVDTAFIGSGMKLQEALVAIAVSDAFGFVNTLDPPTSDDSSAGAP